MISKNQSSGMASAYSFAGALTLPLRLVAGWTYFSAFWRRLVLENKLNPDEAGYIGEKFNHFLPHALGIKPMITYLVSHPEALWWSMLIFTIVEGIVGLLFMFGLFTRLMSFGVFSLALGILLGAGWLGTTCLDEWQIGVLGLAAGFTVFISGGGRYSLDNYLFKGAKPIMQNRGFAWLTSGALPIRESYRNKMILFGSVAILVVTLGTNQYFHGGVYGTLHNLSVKPHVVISNFVLHKDLVSFTVFRDEGADVYGSFLIKVAVKDVEGKEIFVRNQEELALLSPADINNAYVAKVKPGKHSLIIPLGAKAEIRLKTELAAQLKKGKEYTLELTDISGAVWTSRTIDD